MSQTARGKRTRHENNPWNTSVPPSTAQGDRLQLHVVCDQLLPSRPTGPIGKHMINYDSPLLSRPPGSTGKQMIVITDPLLSRPPGSNWRADDRTDPPLLSRPPGSIGKQLIVQIRLSSADRPIGDPDGPMGPKTAPISPQDGSKTPQDAPRRPQDASERGPTGHLIARTSWGRLGGCRGVLGGAGVCMGEDLRRAPRRPGIYIYHVLSIAMCGFTLCSGGPCLSGWEGWVGTLE